MLPEQSLAMRTSALAILAATLAVIVGGCRTRQAARETPPSTAADKAKLLGFEEATALRDQLNDGMIDTMLRYVGNCEVMASRLEEYLSAHSTDYETVDESLQRIPWADQELPPDKLRWRLKKADDAVRKMEPASEACGTNQDCIVVLRRHFYDLNWLHFGPHGR
jgi:hypothetical protein